LIVPRADRSPPLPRLYAATTRPSAQPLGQSRLVPGKRNRASVDHVDVSECHQDRLSNEKLQELHGLGLADTSQTEATSTVTAQGGERTIVPSMIDHWVNDEELLAQAAAAVRHITCRRDLLHLDETYRSFGAHSKKESSTPAGTIPAPLFVSTSSAA